MSLVQSSGEGEEEGKDYPPARAAMKRTTENFIMV